MKYLILGVFILSVTGLFVACGGTEEKEELSTLEKCESSCDKAAECYDEGGSSSYDVAECKETCEEVIDEFESDGCGDAYDKALSCWLDNFSCEPVGSGEHPCESELDDWLDCLPSSGSGS